MSFDPSDPRYEELWNKPKPQAQQQRKKVDAEEIARLLDGIWTALDRIGAALESINPSVKIETPPAQVTVVQPETKREVRILRDEKTRQITGAISEATHG